MARRSPLADKTVFITGAGKGIGATVARLSSERGARVVLVDIDLDLVTELARSLPTEALALEADVRDLSALQAAAATTVERFGSIDYVLANAGVAPPSLTVQDIDPADFERTVEIDLLGQWRTVRAVLPAVARSGGHILAVSSIYAFFNGVLNASYAVSKAGLEQLMRAVDAELIADGASAGTAFLGFVETPLVDVVFDQPQVIAFRKALPGFLTRPMKVDHAAAVLVKGLERRATRVTAPGWVRPALLTRGFVGGRIDRFVARRARQAVAVSRTP